MTTEENSISVICCFCGDGIEYSSAVQLSMKPSPDSEESQGFYCHPKCLHNVLHKDIPRHPDLTTNDSK
jgi:hypothetical protein